MRKQTIWMVMANSKNLVRNVTKGKRGKIMNFILSQILPSDVDKKNDATKSCNTHQLVKQITWQ